MRTLRVLCRNAVLLRKAHTLLIFDSVSKTRKQTTLLTCKAYKIKTGRLNF